MQKPQPTTPEPQASRTWEPLEEFVREQVQRFIQALLEEEVTELLGRRRSARRRPPKEGRWPMGISSQWAGMAIQGGTTLPAFQPFLCRTWSSVRRGST
mgnify:CR=1 FL=1